MRQAYFLIGSTHAPFLSHVGHGWYIGWVWASTFKQIGSLFAGSTIDGNRMICLTKYVTVRVSKGEPNLYDGFWLWLASPQSAARLSVVTCVHVRTHTHAHTDFTRARVFVHTSVPKVSRRCINCKIEISASTIITIVNAISRSLPDPKWFSLDDLKSSMVTCHY